MYAYSFSSNYFILMISWKYPSSKIICLLVELCLQNTVSFFSYLLSFFIKDFTPYQNKATMYISPIYNTYKIGTSCNNFLHIHPMQLLNTFHIIIPCIFDNCFNFLLSFLLLLQSNFPVGCLNIFASWMAQKSFSNQN